MVDPPPLPRKLDDATTIAAVGTLAWLLAALGLLVAHLSAGRPLDIWFSTCVAGVVVGGFGYGIFRWQRRAARRGSRAVQRGVR